MDGVVDAMPRAGAHLCGVGEVGVVGVLRHLGLDALHEQLERSLDEVDGIEHMVDDPEVERLGGGEHPVPVERVVDDHPHGPLDADDAREQLCPAPARDEAEEDLGQREVAGRRCDRPHVAVQRDLDPAAERGARDRGEGGVRQRSDPPEQRVPGRTSLARPLRRDPRELGDVCAGREDQRLSDEQESGPAVLLELLEDLVERGERLRSERVRLLPVRAVVDRDERDSSSPRRGLLQEEAGDGLRGPLALSHAGGSPRGAPRPSRTRCTTP